MRSKTYLRPDEENTKNLGHSNSNCHKNHRTEETNQQEDLGAHRSKAHEKRCIKRMGQLHSDIGCTNEHSGIPKAEEGQLQERLCGH